MPSTRKKRHVKSINLALQGGGSHGAFTWGILDRMFEDDRLWIDAISGTSAGAVNAVVAAQGMHEGQAPAAREALKTFWKAVSDAGKLSPLKTTPFDAALGNWGLDKSPMYLFLDMMQRVASPYDLNPLNINPFRTMIEDLIDFEKVRACKDLGIFISATNVETGRGRVFK
ncbi:MAG: patatin-like phospholipase family protein, partial [Hyphomicrobiales bacterium]